MRLPTVRGLAFSLLPCLAVAAGAATAREPAQIVAEHCAGCHGPTLTGGTAPILLDDAWKYGSDDATILRILRDGIPALGMNPYRDILSEPEQRALLAYLRRQARAFALGQVPNATPLPDAVTFPGERHSFRLETVARGLDTPWSIVFLPDNSMLVSDRVGALRVIGADGVLAPEPIRGTPKPFVKQDGGFLDLIAHPDYAKNGWLYLAYTELGADGRASGTVVVRGKIKDGAWTDEHLIFRAAPQFYFTDTSHYGCRFLFDPTGHLFFTIGDRGQSAHAQDLGSPLGKVHRVRADGTIPADNPFVGRAGAVASIWTYGNRHPQGLQYHPVTGKLWATEHGPRGGDELNRLEPGRNYGWPTASHGLPQSVEKILGPSLEGAESPVVFWTPSIAPAAIEFYAGDRFPRWRNHLFIASLVGRRLLRLETQGDKVVHQEVLFKEQGRVRDVVTGPDGLLYVALNNPGRIARLVPAQ